MLSRVRSQLTYANVMATIAVFLALGGGVAWALATNSVKSKHIKDGQVKTNDLSDDVEAHGFTYSASTGDAVQEELFDFRGYRMLAACDDNTGEPSLEIILEFPESGKLTGFGVTNDSSGTGSTVPGTGEGLNVTGGTPFDIGSVDADPGESLIVAQALSYNGSSAGALLNLHLVADDDDDECKASGTLVPGIIPAV